MPYCIYEPQSVLKNSRYQPYCDRLKATYLSTHNHRPINKTVKEARSVDTAIPNSHILHSTITERLQKYTDLKEELIKYGN